LDIPVDSFGWLVTALVAVIFIALVGMIAWWMRK